MNLKMEIKMIQQTLGMIKPDAVNKNVIGEIIKMIEDKGIKIKAVKMTKLTKETAENFYQVHKGKGFFEELINFMISGPVIPMILEGEDVISRYRELMGATNFKDAKDGTIRKRFATAIEKNAVHGSDSPENAEVEINFFFSKEEQIAVQ